MILVTVGTSHLPFDRLLRALPPVEGERLVVQHGPSQIRPDGAECIDYTPHHELLELMREARLVVAHAGVGSIQTALLASRRPLVVPRRRAFGEAADDHQVALGTRLAREDVLDYLPDPGQLPAALSARPPDRPAVAPPVATALADDLRAYLVGRVSPARAATGPRPARVNQS